MSSTVDILSDDEVRDRRADVLRAVGVSEQELRERGARYALTAHELAALEELNGLDYLRDGVPSER